MHVRLVTLVVVALLAGVLLAYTIFGLVVTPPEPVPAWNAPDDLYPGWKTVVTDLAGRAKALNLRAQNLEQLARELTTVGPRELVQEACGRAEITPRDFLALARRLGREEAQLTGHERRLADLARRQATLKRRLAQAQAQGIGRGAGEEFLQEEQNEIERQLAEAIAAAPALEDSLFARNRQEVSRLFRLLKGEE